jgi:hypothetical protein
MAGNNPVIAGVFGGVKTRMNWVESPEGASGEASVIARDLKFQCDAA